ncbi:hypothetical protein D9758_004670 [Tetrapyrgos nigripes]|uniref:P-loop containing nucleoside triphosphate hydrolase protein n=1 Tax=Tetrapyrgos nigripes TaxID=182062 RepID=A0A8H5LYS2_9AGAR|nr:hypothetical protein D9758_004670 [Tetrapyrgos nigripes]
MSSPNRDAKLPSTLVSKASVVAQTRGYQQEMLEESLGNNIIIAMDTGSGKTHIAILRLKIEAERELRKVSLRKPILRQQVTSRLSIQISWFFAPTVVLCEQQHAVIEASLPVPVGLLTGALEPDQWKDASLWKRTLESYRVVVSTPQVLLDALHHGYIVLGRDIGLLIFDEAHHAVDNHPYNRIMQNFYSVLPPRTRNVLDGTGGQSSPELVRPMILGLTASPIYGGDVDRAFQMIERNMDSFIRTPRIHRDELGEFVHRPVFKHMLYDPPDKFNPQFSTNLAALADVVKTMNIENDPYVRSLRQQLAKATPSSSGWHRLDQKLSKTITKQDSFTHKGLRDFLSTAEVILKDVGAWAADWYVWKVLEQAKQASDPLQDMMPTWRNQEKGYLLSIIRSIQVIPVSYHDDDIIGDVSDKVVALVQSLLTEKEEEESRNDRFSGLVFVERRDVVLALTEVLQNHPVTRDSFQVGPLLGTSESGRRHAFLDITRHIVKQTQAKILMDFKIGERDLIISTSVAEEGLDIQACGCVIRWDPPKNMASWAQSRGRARKKQSTFMLMFERGTSSQKDVEKWEFLESEMVAKYNDPLRDLFLAEDEDPNSGNDEDMEFKVESTKYAVLILHHSVSSYSCQSLNSALLTLQSAIPHLNHFCAVMPSRDHVDFRPIYDLDPPDYPMGWHHFLSRSTALSNPYQGPWGATVTLPRTLPDNLRVFRTEVEYPTKTSAKRHAAFKAYVALYHNGLLSDQLLPITDHDVQEATEDIEKRVGMANVQSGQIDPWMATSTAFDQDTNWFYSELTFGDLPPLHIMTRTRMEPWGENNGPILYLPTGENMQVTLCPRGRIDQLDDPELFIENARKYTFMLLASINGSRMDPDRMDFSYLFLPAYGRDDVWSGYMDALDEESESQVYGSNVNALEFGQMYDFPDDISMVRDGARFNKPYQFIDWYWDKEGLTEEEAEHLLERYGEIDYPLVKVRPFHPRTNFLAPRSGAAAELKHKYLIAKKCFVVLLSPDETKYVFLLPSVLRALSMSLTAQSLRRYLFGETSPLSIIPDDLLTVAITAPVSQERKNYQRLETLGDTVLKFIVVIQLLAEHPAWPEGYLTKAKDHAVSNVRLAKENLSRNVFQWIIRDRMLGKKWKPDYEKLQTLLEATSGELASTATAPPPVAMEVDSAPYRAPSAEGKELVTAEKGDGKKRKKKKKSSHQISTKVLADVIESLIGAAFSYGGFDLGYECTKFFDLGLKNWMPLPKRIDSLLRNVREYEELPPQVNYVERILDYTFRRKMLLIEALTHPTHQQNLGTISYERLEFLGDSILDMVCTDYLFNAEGKEYSPGHMHMRKSAMVNAHMLAFLCLKASTGVETAIPRPDLNGDISLRKDNKTIHLEQCLFHSSSKVLEEQRMTLRRFERRREEIEQGLTQSDIFPWAALTRLQAPKFFSDMMESIIGAVFLDSDGNFDVVRRVLHKLGFMQILEHIVKANVDVLHPVSRVSMWAQQNEHEVEFRSQEEKGKVICMVMIDGEPLKGAMESDVKHGKGTIEEVRFAAAEKAIMILRLRTVDGGKKKSKERVGRKQQ